MEYIYTMDEGTGDLAPRGWLPLKDSTLRLSVYGDGDVKAVEIRVDDDALPLKVGESFACTVVSVTREVTER